MSKTVLCIVNASVEIPWALCIFGGGRERSNLAKIPSEICFVHQNIEDFKADHSEIVGLSHKL